MNFTAIDFETATGYRNSACAVGVVTVNGGTVTDQFYSLIRPPRNHYWPDFTEIHGITPEQTENAPTFATLYPTLRPLLEGRLLVAHNAPFDKSVLSGTMKHHGLCVDTLKLQGWACTMQIYRRQGFKPYGLNACCDRFGIPLQHHHALSDALGCAELFSRQCSRP